MSALLEMMMAAFTAAGGGGGGNIAYRAGAAGSGVSGGAITITKPAGVVSGDVMYALILQDAGSLPVLAGWTQLGTGNTPTNTFPVTVLRKVAGGSEGASYAFAVGATLGEGIIVAFSGVNATPEDATTTSGTGTAATITYPSITSVHADSWHLTLAGNFNATPSTPAGYTARQSSATWCKCSSKDIASAGAVSGVTSTGGGQWVAFSVLVRSS